ncbi:hypothetical protein SEUCBS139899_003532 [Sporothrix eucalyptigena]|uniref:Integral membrane protein n=1 Tax=Sporothrix eucalyptigena TaxID=1812306 RepID=A0ABP0B6L1_9PEZI
MFFPSHAVPMGISGPMNSASSSSSSGTGGVVGHDAASSHPLVGHHHWWRVPVWAYVIISIIAFVTILFVVASIYHGIRERRLARIQNRKASIRTIAGKALEIALFLWVFALLARCLCSRKRKTGSTSYRKVDNAGEMTANNNIYSSTVGYGIAQPGPSGAAYGDGGSGSHEPISEKYEPMGYLGSGTTAVTVGGAGTTAARGNSTAPPYSPNSAFAFQQDTSYAPTNVSSIPPPVHITPSVSPIPTPIPTPAAVTEPLMAHSSSATYVPGQDSHPMY